MMTPVSPCPECGAALRDFGLRGVCPRCALRRALAPAPLDPGALFSGSIHLLQADGSAPMACLRGFGDYELIEELGHGGMGIIFKARQRSLDRIVALKLIRGGSLARPEDIARFRTEAAAAARLQHPHIVAIYEVGEHEGQHFYSMEFVPGHSLARELRTGPIAHREAARLLLASADAIHFAHQRGVLHRDLKPSNILLDAERQPRVADFGLAKILQSDSELTVSGAVIGSPQYMPPEQARGRSAEASTRSDVYSLGAILYDLLTGHPPFSAATPLETMKLVAEREPISPRVLNPSIPRDLETICLKCLAKEPAARYASAADLSDELSRYLRHEPIRARPLTYGERAWRWCRRQPALAGLGFVLLLAPAMIIMMLLVTRAKVAREAENLRQNLYASNMHLANSALAEDNSPGARKLLQAQRPGPGQVDLRGFEWRWLWAQSTGHPLLTLTGGMSAAICVLFSPDGRRLAAGDDQGMIRVWDTATWRLFAACDVSSKNLRRLSFSADGGVLAMADHNRNVWVRDLETGSDLLALEGVVSDGEPDVTALFSPLGTKFVVPSVGKNGERAVRVFDSSERQAGRARELFLIPGGTFTEAFLPDGRLLLMLSNHFGAYDLERRKFDELPYLRTHPYALSPDGKMVAAADLEQRNAVFLRPLEGGETMWLRSKVHGEATGLARFSPDGRWLLTASSSGGALRFWDTRRWDDIAKLTLDAPANDAAFSPDGRWIATATQGAVSIWPGIAEAEPPRWINANLPCVISPNGRYLAFSQWKVQPGAARAELDGFAIGELATGRLTRVSTVEPRATPVFLSDQGDMLAVMRHVTNGLFQLERHDVRHGSREAVRTFQVTDDDKTQDQEVVFDGAGERIFSTNVAARVSLGARIARPREITNWPLYYWRATREGRRLGFSNARGTVTVWDTASGAKLTELPAENYYKPYWFFSPDGEQLGRSFQSGQTTWLEGWRVSGGVRCFRQQLPAQATDIAYAPDGRWLAAISSSEVHILDSQNGHEIRRVPSGSFSADCLAISADARTIAVGGAYGSVLLLHAATGRSVATLSTAESATHDSVYSGVKPIVARWPRLLAFSPDNQTLLAMDWGGWVRVWSAPFAQ